MEGARLRVKDLDFEMLQPPLRFACNLFNLLRLGFIALCPEFRHPEFREEYRGLLEKAGIKYGEKYLGK